MSEHPPRYMCAHQDLCSWQRRGEGQKLSPAPYAKQNEVQTPQFQIQSLPKIAQTHLPNQSPLCIIIRPFLDKGLSWWLSSKESTCNAEDVQETQVRSLDREDPPGEGNDNPLQYSYLENPMDRGAWRTMVHGVTRESDTT